VLPNPSEDITVQNQQNKQKPQKRTMTSEIIICNYIEIYCVFHFRIMIQIINGLF